jgi:hypothetical protein
MKLRFFARPAAMFVFLILISSGFVFAQIVDLQADYPKGDCLKRASEPRSARFQVRGPGHLEVTVKQEPYRHAGRTVFSPETWTTYINGKMQGWGDLGPAVTGRGRCSAYNSTQNGKPVRNFAEGMPLQTVYSCELLAGDFDFGVRIGPPTMNYGCGATQWSQRSRLIVDYSPGSGGSKPVTLNPESPRTPGPSDSSNIVGLWTMNIGNKLEIVSRGSSYAVRMSAEVGQWDTMLDVKFDAATNTIEWRRDLKSKGYPDQIFTGSPANGRLDGRYRWASEKPGTGNGWYAVRLK